jgi:hypothetical protein
MAAPAPAPAPAPVAAVAGLLTFNTVERGADGLERLTGTAQIPAEYIEVRADGELYLT